MITWCYNRLGHVSIWNGDIGYPGNRLDSEVYLQIDTDVESFFEHIGMNVDDIYCGDWDICTDPGYFID